MKTGWKRSSLIYIAILIVAIVVIVVFSNLFSRSQKPTEIPLSEAVTMSQENRIEKIFVKDNTLLITATDGIELRTFKENNASIYEIEGLNLEGIEIEIEGSSRLNTSNMSLTHRAVGGLGGLYYIDKSSLEV